MGTSFPIRFCSRNYIVANQVEINLIPSHFNCVCEIFSQSV